MADSALISRLRAAASVSALRAASGGCASTRACGRSPEGEALETQKRGRFRALSACRKRCAHPLAPSARGLRPQAVGERTVRLSEIFRAMARFSPSAPSGHLPRRGRFFDTMRLSPKGKAFRYACSCTYRINASRSAEERTTAVYIQSPMSRRSAWGIRSHIRIREPYLAMICAWVCLYSWQSRRPA